MDLLFDVCLGLQHLQAHTVNNGLLSLLHTDLLNMKSVWKKKQKKTLEAAWSSVHLSENI